MMGLGAVLADERVWYAVDRYRQKGQKLFKVASYGPFLATVSGCATVLERLKKQHPGDQIVCQEWSGSAKRWVRRT